MQFTEDQNILRNLIYNEEYARCVFPFLKKDYFDGSSSVIFSLYGDFFNKYNKLPTCEALGVELSNSTTPEGLHEEANNVLGAFKTSSVADDLEWLIDNTERYCQDKSLFLAMQKSLAIMQGKN